MSNTGLVYIASTLTNADRVRRLRGAIAAMGMGLSYDWAGGGGDPYVPDSDMAAKLKAANAEVSGVMRADVVLAVMPGGRGTHFEMGLAYAAGRPIVLLTDEHSGDTPCFHFLAGIDRYDSEDLAIAAVAKYAAAGRGRHAGGTT